MCSATRKLLVTRTVHFGGMYVLYENISARLICLNRLQIQYVIVWSQSKCCFTCLWSQLDLVVFKNSKNYSTISVANRQNPFPLHLVKLRNRALKFLVHFSLVCLGKCPKAHEKWSQMEKPIWGSISQPSGMLWRPFRGRFLQILQPKGVF